MADLASLTADVFDMLYGVAQVERPAEDTLATAVSSAADVSWQFTTPAVWGRNDYGEDAAAGELVVFAAAHPDAGDATVRRGQRGTTALAAYAAGDVFYKNPTFPRHVVERFINETVDGDLFPHVWTWASTTVSWVTGQTTYELPADCEGVGAVYQADIDGDGRFHPIDRSLWEYVPVVDSALSSNGNFLRLFRVYAEDETIYVTYKQRPSSAALASMSDELAALVPWGVLAKLLGGTRVAPARSAPGRSTPIPQVSGSQLLRDYAFFDQQFRQMRADEKRRLRGQVFQQKQRRRARVRRG